MRLTLFVFIRYFQAWLVYHFKSGCSSKFEYAAYNLFQKSFRIPETDRHKPFLVIRVFFSVVKVLLFSGKPKSGSVKEDNKSKLFVYDLSEESYVQRKKYIEHFTKDEIGGGIFKLKLLYSPGKNSILLILFYTIWLPFLFITSLLKKEKAPFALIFREIIETINLLRIVESLSISKIFFFCIYEKDANLCTLLLQEKNVHVTKIPSEVPLYVWNKILIADKLCVCNGYQFDELKAFKKSIFVSETEFWGPERILENLRKYETGKTPEKNTIGFYSTGAWIRKLENHADQGLDMCAAEDAVKKSLFRFCKNNPGVKLRLFLHPREHWEKYQAIALEKYQNDFKGIEYEIIGKETKSSQAFELADIGVAFHSTIVYERLYFGFKTLLMPLGYSDFPLPSSGLRNICAFSEDELFQKISDNSALTNTEFFSRNQINHLAKYLFN